MEINEPLPKALSGLEGADVYTHGHLPVAAAFCRRLGLAELVNKMVPSKMNLKPGYLVQALVLDTLSGRTPLYRVKDFMEENDIELLLGQRIPASDFEDTNIARGLDAIFNAGPTKILTQLGVNATKAFGLNIKAVSYDTTSTSLWGDYAICESKEDAPGPTITHGYSKDHRPDLKQFMTELLCVERGIPIFGRTLDGNSSDKTSNNKTLTRISKLMARHGLGSGAFVYVADSAMVTEQNLESIGENYFITRLPANYAECNRVIDAAVTSGDWRDLGTLAETPTKGNRPKAIYRALESGVELYGKSYRATVVHSSSHDRRRQKKLEKAIATSQKELAKRLSKLESVYYCEADAESASKKSKALSTKLHQVVPRITPFEVRKPGRPPINAPASTKKKYRLTWDIVQDTKAIEREKQKAGCFVLLSNIPIDGENDMESRELLLTYKGQYGVESNFGFLKDPLVVNDIFLKKPHRIDTLGMVLIIALLVWRLMERTARRYLKDNDKYIEGWNKRPTQKPTSFMISTAIVGIMVAVVANRRIFLRAPGQRQKDFLLALAVDENVFLDPQARCHPKIPSKKGEFG